MGTRFNGLCLQLQTAKYSMHCINVSRLNFTITKGFTVNQTLRNFIAIYSNFMYLTTKLNAQNND